MPTETMKHVGHCATRSLQRKAVALTTNVLQVHRVRPAAWLAVTVSIIVRRITAIIPQEQRLMFPGIPSTVFLASWHLLRPPSCAGEKHGDRRRRPYRCRGR